MSTSPISISPVQLKSDALQRIRPDLNLEKWTLWQPAKSRGNLGVRVIRREVKLSCGQNMTAEVEIGFTNKGVLTTEDQKTFYSLIKVWEESGQSEAQTYYSLRRLATILGKKWGTNVIDATTASLVRLRVTPITWRYAYHDSVEKTVMEILEPFNILSELKTIRRKADGHVTRAFGYFRFNDFILKNLLNHYTKPVLIDTVLSFRSEIAQLIYTHLDLLMAHRNHYERRTRNLFFDDLGLESASYQHIANRVQKLKPALSELQGVALSSGLITAVSLERTKDNLDYKIVVHKKPHLKRPQSYSEEQPEKVSGDEGVTHPLTSEALDLLTYFQRVFHRTEHSIPTSKAISQAVSLLAQYGPEKARYLIDFGHKAAAETRYNIQFFGGLLQYETQAFRTYDAEQSREQQQDAIESCVLCDKNGLILFERNDSMESFSVRCPHDESKIREYEQKKNCQRL